jgi:hypothetical protein
MTFGQQNGQIRRHVWERSVGWTGGSLMLGVCVAFSRGVFYGLRIDGRSLEECSKKEMLSWSPSILHTIGKML